MRFNLVDRYGVRANDDDRGTEHAPPIRFPEDGCRLGGEGAQAQAAIHAANFHECGFGVVAPLACTVPLFIQGGGGFGARTKAFSVAPAVDDLVEILATVYRFPV